MSSKKMSSKKKISQTVIVGYAVPTESLYTKSALLTCACGTRSSNISKFCYSCGKKLPEPAVISRTQYDPAEGVLNVNIYDGFGSYIDRLDVIEFGDTAYVGVKLLSDGEMSNTYPLIRDHVLPLMTRSIPNKIGQILGLSNISAQPVVAVLDV